MIKIQTIIDLKDDHREVKLPLNNQRKKRSIDQNIELKYVSHEIFKELQQFLLLNNNSQNLISR